MLKNPYFPTKPIKLDYIYFHVGRVSINWANAENAVDACLRVFSLALPDPLYTAPRSTKRRISTFRKQIKMLSLSDLSRNKGTALIDRFSYLAWHRHWTTHGVLSNQCYEGQTWRKARGLVFFERVNLSTSDLEVLEISLSNLEDMGDEALTLTADLWDWLAVDIGCSTPKKTEQIVRKIGMSTS